MSCASMLSTVEPPGCIGGRFALCVLYVNNDSCVCLENTVLPYAAFPVLPVFLHTPSPTLSHRATRGHFGFLLCINRSQHKHTHYSNYMSMSPHLSQPREGGREGGRENHKLFQLYVYVSTLIAAQSHVFISQCEKLWCSALEPDHILTQNIDYVHPYIPVNIPISAYRSLPSVSVYGPYK